MMYLESDIFYTIALLMLMGIVALAYTIRLSLRGRARFDRVNRQGGSVLLGKGLMEMAYWSLQPIAKALVFLKMTPNQLSWASLVSGGCAGVALAYGSFGFAAFLATVSAFLDSLDGMVARMTSVSSDAGEVLDATIDRYVEFFFLAGLVLYYRHVPVLQAVSLCALVGSFMISYSTAKAEALHIPPPPGIMRRPERAFYLILGAAFSPIPTPAVDAFFSSNHPVGLPMVIALTVVAILSNISAIERLYTVAHAVRLRELHNEHPATQIETEAEVDVTEEPEFDVTYADQPKST
jgi:phosphatidylglycerophosphate synthase